MLALTALATLGERAHAAPPVAAPPVAAPADAIPSDASSAKPPAPPPEALQAQVEQQTIPALAARQETATRQALARRAYFAGSATLDAAFPHLATANLSEPAVLAGRVALLDERALQRASERVSPLPSLSAPDRERLAQLRERTLDAEDEADALERRLLLGLRGLLEQHPELRAHALQPLRAPLQARVTAPVPETASPEQRATAAREAALADEELARLDALVRDLWRLATVPGASPPDPSRDVALLADPQTAAAARARLSLVGPFLDESGRASLEAAELAWAVGPGVADATARHQSAATALDQASTAPLQATEADLAAELARREQRVIDAEAALAAIDGGTPLGAARRAIAELDLAGAKLERDAAAIRVSRARSGGNVAAETDRARRDAEVSRQEAEAARASAQDADAAHTADLLARAATAQERATERWAATEERRASVEQSKAGHRDRLARLAEEVHGVVNSSTLVGGPDADGVYVEVRALVQQLREEAVQEAAEIPAARAVWRDTAARVATERELLAAGARSLASLSESARRNREAALARWEQALDDEEEAASEGLAIAKELRDDTLVSLVDARALRRMLRPEISREQRRADRDELLRDLYSEVRLLGPSVAGFMGDRFRDLRGIPTALSGYNLLVSLIIGSIWTIVLVVGWWIGKQNLGRGVSWGLERVEQGQARWVRERFRALQKPVENTLGPLLDLVAASLLVTRVGLPEIRFAVVMWNFVATYRLGLALYELSFVRRADRRIALRTLGDEAWALGRLLVRGALLWWLIGQFVEYIATAVLGLDAIASLLGTIQWLVGFVLALQWMQLAEPILRARVSGQASRSAFAGMLAQGPPDRWQSLRFAWALGSTGFLAAGWATDVSWRLGREGSGLGRLLNVLGRYRMARKVAPGETAKPPPAEVLAALSTEDCAPEARLVRPEVEKAVTDGFADWQRERRRGLVAVLGDRGEGKRLVIDGLCATIEAEGFAIRRVEFTSRLITADDALQWLVRELELDVSERDVTSVVHAIERKPTTVFVIESLEQAFLRTVGGFDALRVLLYVMNACGDEHFFIVTAHRPAWKYLARLGDLVNLEVFRAVVETPPLGEATLRELALKRLELAGYEADFSGLVRHNPFGDDPAVEHERTVSLFFRVLGEASGGNPAVALHMFAACLSAKVPREKEQRGVVEVRLAPMLTDGTLADLRDPDLFTLMALRTQGQLDEAELAAMTNVNEAATRAIVRRLQSLGILVREADRLQIAWEYLPRVTRALRRRHFIQWTV